MSACTPDLPHDELICYPKPNLIVINHDAPNLVRVPHLPRHVVAINHGLLAVQESLGRRVNLRVDFESRVTWRASYDYKRMRGNAIVLSAPNAEQAELFIAALHAFAQSLDGKWLASPSTLSGDPTPGPKTGPDGD